MRDISLPNWEFISCGAKEVFQRVHGPPYSFDIDIGGNPKTSNIFTHGTPPPCLDGRRRHLPN